ncbi:MAG TPA: L,D-transpeptidase, partial [bacterium]|nr:L,D-transpeptidase [bacterium]
VYPTPAQESSIKRIEWNPWWYPPPSDWAKDDKPTPPGKSNPLGLVKMPLSSAILFHGTNKEKSIGRAVSHGCIRMYNADAVEVAWYLQSRFSEKKDPSFLESYNRNRKKTYVVRLDRPVPVGLIYKPAILKGDSIAFYPDYYRKLIRKRAAVTEELLAAGANEECIDVERVDDAIKVWPKKGTLIPVKDFLIDSCR